MPSRKPPPPPPEQEPNEPQPTRATPLVENLLATELYAEEVSSFFLHKGMVTLTLTSLRWDNSTQPAMSRRVVVGRVTMPATSARTLVNQLHNFLDKQGLSAVPEGEKKRIQ